MSIFLVFFVLFPKLAFATDSGPNFPSTAVNDTTGCGTCVDWVDPGNTTVSDNVYATRSLTSGQTSSYLKATNFGFSIPTGATINGILVEWEVSITGTDAASDNAARIVKGGTIGVTDKSNATVWTTTDTFLSHGGSSDLWGETWTVSDVNATNFGAALKASLSSGFSASAQIDSVRITVTYTVPTISISGTVYTNEGSTTMGSGRTVAVSINGAAAAGTNATAANGTYSITGLTVSAGDVLTLYLDGAAEKGVTVTVGTGSNMTGIDIYQNDLITRCDNASCSLTNANLDTADNNADADISAIYSFSSGVPATASGKSLFIPTGHTFAPGGDVNLGGNFTNNGTYTAGTSTISITDTGSGSKTFNGASKTYYNLSISGGGAGAVIIQGSNTFNNFTINSPKTVTFTSSTTTTVANFTCSGSLGNVITINSSSAGSAATLSKSSGAVSCDYLSLKDSAATGGATWNAGVNSTDNGGNSGWVFNLPPGGGGPGGGGSSIFDQKHFKIYKDNSGLNSADSYADEDTNYNVLVNTAFRIRFGVANTGNAPANIERRLEFKQDSGSWTQITADTNSVRLFNSPNFQDGDATTQRLTAAGAFIEGQGKYASSNTSQIVLFSNSYVEDEYSIIFQFDALGHAYQFRITNRGVDLDAYTVIPSIKPNKTPPTGAPPIPSGFNPASGSTIKTATPNITFSLDKDGDCRASTINNSYDNMLSNTICAGGQSTFMNCLMPDLGANGSKTIYFACQDTLGNKDTLSTTHNITYALNSSSSSTASLIIKGMIKFSGHLIIK